jgi:hypothetical protein
MFPVGGVGVMLVLIAAAGLAAALFGVLLRRAGAGRSLAVTIGLLAWSLATVAVVTLIPAHGPPGVVPAEGRLPSCSWDIGGPAPDGFWIIRGAQRLLNVALFVPSGALMTYACAHARGWAWAMVPWGLVALALFSAGLELTQLGLARLDRACDVTDIVDNVTGAGLGVLLGVTAALVLRPWRRRPRATGR